MGGKKNISITINSFTSGGAEKVISLLLTRLKDDYHVTLVLFYNEIHFPIPKEVDTIVFSKNKASTSFFKKIVEIPVFIYKYYRTIKQKQIHCAITFLAFPNLINGLMAKLVPTLKTIISERGYQNYKIGGRIPNAIASICYPILYNWNDGLFSNSIHINQDLMDNFGIKIPLAVIYNPILLPEKTVRPDDLEVTTPFKIATVGSIDYRKNQSLILKAVKLLDTDQVQVQIMGSGPMEESLKEETEQLELNEQVVFLGRVKNVDQHLLHQHCFVLSSRSEGFPNALLEALAVGLPSISTNCISGPLEMLNDNEEVSIDKGAFHLAKYGLLINNDDEVGLSRAIEFLKNNAPERKKYSKLALERAKEYELDNIYGKFRSFIDHGTN